MKKILIVWIIVAVFLVAGLTFIGFELKTKNKPYKAIENDLRESAQAYIGIYPSFLSDGTKTITNDTLIDEKLSTELKVEKEICSGYVVVSSNMGLIDYKPYIKCDNYKTRGYEK